MKVLTIKVLTKRNVSESWVSARKCLGQALTGGHAGCVLSREIAILGADAVEVRGRQHLVAHFGEGSQDPTRSETTRMHVSTMRGSREILRSFLSVIGDRVANSKEVRPR